MAMQFPSLAEVGDKIGRAARRFPLAMASAVVGTFLIYWMIESSDNNRLEEEIGRWVLAISLGLPLFTGLAVFSEQNNHSPGLRRGLELAGIAALAFAWWAVDPGNEFREMHNLVWYFGLSLLFHLFVSFAAYLKKEDSVTDFWEFNKQLLLNFLTGALYSGIILAGVSIAIAAANELFHLHVGWKIWPRLFATVLGLFQSAYFLSNFPADFHFDQSEARYELFVKNLVKWILIPIVGLYFLILYAYSGKILVSFHLPVGWASSLVVGFAAAGIFTWLMNFMLPRIDSAGIISWFKKWFWPILAPVLILLFVAVARRIRDYGLTEDRYLVAHLGLWLAAMAAYFILSKKDDIRIIPVSLAIFTIVYLLPGVGGMDAGIRAQTRILTGLMEKNGVLKDGKAVPLKETLTGGDAYRMVDIIQYLAERDALWPLAGWLGKPEDELKKNGHQWSASNEIAGMFKIDEFGGSRNPAVDRSLYRSHADQPVAFATMGFDSASQVSLYVQNNARNRLIGLGDDGSSVEFDRKKTDLAPVLEKLWAETSDSQCYLGSLEWLEFDGTTLKGRLVLTDLHIRKEGDKLSLQGINGWLLTKKK